MRNGLIFTLRFNAGAILPPFIGNAIRRAFGQSLCDNYPGVCEKVFKTQRMESVPNPFAISAPYPGKGGYKAGDTLGFGITLFGDACGITAIAYLNHDKPPFIRSMTSATSLSQGLFFFHSSSTVSM